MNSYLILIVTVLASGFASLAGCVPEDDSEAVQQLATTVASVSEKAVEEQSRLNLRVADATDSLVKADSEARTAMIQAHEHIQLKLQFERASLDQRRQDLDSLKDRVEGDRRDVLRSSLTRFSPSEASLLAFAHCFWRLTSCTR